MRIKEPEQALVFACGFVWGFCLFVLWFGFVLFCFISFCLVLKGTLSIV